jgi:hypothetical protein
MIEMDYKKRPKSAKEVIQLLIDETKKLSRIIIQLKIKSLKMKLKNHL